MHRYLEKMIKGHTQEGIYLYKNCTIDSVLPLNIGQTSHTWYSPFPLNCPIDVSKKNKGIPQNTRKNINGMRNAPEKELKDILVFNTII